MGLEAATYISQLISTNPLGADDRSTADDHIRLLKAVLKAQFPNLGAAAVTTTAAELSILTGALLSTLELNILSGAALTTEELNILAGATLTTEELNTLSGIEVTAAQLNAVASLGLVTSDTFSNNNVPSTLDLAIDPSGVYKLYVVGAASYSGDIRVYLNEDYIDSNYYSDALQVKDGGVTYSTTYANSLIGATVSNQNICEYEFTVGHQTQVVSMHAMGGEVGNGGYFQQGLVRHTSGASNTALRVVWSKGLQNAKYKLIRIA